MWPSAVDVHRKLSGPVETQRQTADFAYSSDCAWAGTRKKKYGNRTGSAQFDIHLVTNNHRQAQAVIWPLKITGGLMHGLWNYLYSKRNLQSFVCYIEPLGSDGNKIESDSDSDSAEERALPNRSKV